MPDAAVRPVPAPASPTAGALGVLRPLGLDAARITGGLWAARQEANRRASIPAGAEQLDRAGNLRNLEILAGETQGEAIGPVFADSDVHKWLEAAAWELGRGEDERLACLQRRVTDLLARAQADDGYLDSVVQLRENERYRELPWSHELYCAGHLFQAAVAQVRATGSRELLDVATRLADHLVATFGDGRPGLGDREDVDGHPVVETALVELYRETGTRAYLDLARYFVEARGHGHMERYGAEPTYFSDRLPVRETPHPEGHAVRAVYLGAGATDVAVETGDTELLAALERQYAAMERSQQYLTGGLGSRWEGESFGDPYELPADRAYAETCASIGGVQWAWRLLLATGEARYGDQIERMLLNGFLSGLSLAGTEYFYVNPLQLRADAEPEENRSPAHGRRGWFDCACCPPNIMRTLSSLTAYLATRTDAGLQIHQYAPGPISSDGLSVRVETGYPYDGRVVVHVDEVPGRPVEIALRVPAWAEGATLDGAPVAAGGYARTTGLLAAGDTVDLVLPMAPRLTTADARVDAVRGCVAIERGPLVYALEQPDQAAGVVVDDARLDPDETITVERRDDLLGGTTVLRARGRVVRAPDGAARAPYRPLGDAVPTDGGDDERDVELVAIPYHLWANRGPQPMRVWIPLA
ncbi:glycoside hydrolase family 127 protein [Cellulomonas sp. PhB143]|uniref:glycoside hydrolase family 127 protein n=1 Tax=Cellulomonas sp. PhB143 TaxID=2485186 RepID=UPI000F46B5E3|nr:beta-L-arabinofuranosidase domain-containing protein [Cellulomonas sp. PhB143]ROS73347.1 hypothetical protein EDF32_2614 [Cellulomonas sp. PhB143]